MRRAATATQAESRAFRDSNIVGNTDTTWTIPDLADRWRVSTWTVRRWIDLGHIKIMRLGPNTLRISDAERRRFEEACVE